MSINGIKVRRLGYVTTGGRLSDTPNEPYDELSNESPNESSERLEYFTNGGQLSDTAFSAFIKKEEDSGTFPIPYTEFDLNKKLLSIKKENDYGEAQLEDFQRNEYKDEDEDEFECECVECLKKEIILIDKEEYLRNDKQNASEVESVEHLNTNFKDFCKGYVNQNKEYSKTIHRHHYNDVKIVYECTYENCHLTLSSLKTIYIHLRIRHLNLKATLCEQRQQKRLETKLPLELRPEQYVLRKVNHLVGFLLTEDQERRLEEVFICASKLDIYEREELSYRFKICESVIIDWFQVCS